MNSDNRDFENTPNYSFPFGRLLAGQKALVTGASSGIGRVVALAFARAGADVAINFFAADEALDTVLSTVQKAGAKAIAIRADVSREDQVQAMFERAIAEMGTIDILVNNAGIQDHINGSVSQKKSAG
jgi:glucose 1-dehydrogenase